MSQEAPPAVDDGSDDGHGESDGRGGTHESRGQADGEERPRLRKEDGGSEVRVFGFKLPGRRETCHLIMLKESNCEIVGCNLSEEVWRGVAELV